MTVGVPDLADLGQGPWLAVGQPRTALYTTLCLPLGIVRGPACPAPAQRGS